MKLKHLLESFVFGVLFTFGLLLLLPVSGVVALIAGRLLSASSYVLFWRPWFGLDCANADSISDKLNCAGLGLSVDVLIYAATCFVFLTLWQRARPTKVLSSRGHSGTLGLG